MQRKCAGSGGTQSGMLGDVQLRLFTNDLNIYRRSKQVQRAETLTPTTTVLQASGKLRCCVPCYTATILAIHPQLDGWQLPSRGGLQLIDLKRFRSFYMQAIRREFVTSPRWNAVAVKTCHSGLTDNQKVTEVGQHCVVYVRTGVRIADLQNAVEALVSQAISRGLDDEGSELWAELACGNESEAKELDMTKEWDEQRRLPIQIRRWHRTRPMK